MYIRRIFLVKDSCPLCARDCGTRPQRKAGSHRIRRTVTQCDQGSRRRISRRPGARVPTLRWLRRGAGAGSSPELTGTSIVRRARGDLLHRAYYGCSLRRNATVDGGGGGGGKRCTFLGQSNWCPLRPL